MKSREWSGFCLRGVVLCFELWAILAGTALPFLMKENLIWSRGAAFSWREGRGMASPRSERKATKSLRKENVIFREG
jgi:hypothetical protein